MCALSSPPVCTCLRALVHNWSLQGGSSALFDGPACSARSGLVVLAFSILSLATFFSHFPTPEQPPPHASLSRLAKPVCGCVPTIGRLWWFLLRWSFVTLSRLGVYWFSCVWSWVSPIPEYWLTSMDSLPTLNNLYLPGLMFLLNPTIINLGPCHYFFDLASHSFLLVMT